MELRLLFHYRVELVEASRVLARDTTVFSSWSRWNGESMEGQDGEIPPQRAEAKDAA